LGEGRGEGKKLAMQEVIAKHSFQLPFLGLTGSLLIIKTTCHGFPTDTLDNRWHNHKIIVLTFPIRHPDFEACPHMAIYQGSGK
jgi:hypothetical protein